MKLLNEKILLFVFFLSATLDAAIVQVQVIGQGEVIGAGSYTTGSNATLQAIPKPGHEFRGWSGELVGNENPLTIKIDSDIKAQAHFEPSSNNIIYVNGMPAIAGSFLAKLNDQGRRLLKRRVNQVGSSKVFRRNRVLTDLVTIEWDAELNLKNNLNAQNLSADALKNLSQKKSALKSVGIRKQIKELMDSGNYDFVEPNWILQASAQPSDGGFSDGRLWGLRNYGQSGGSSGVDINAVSAWDRSTGSNEVIVAVIDTGVRYTHNDLASNMWKNPNEIANNGRDDDGNGFVDDVYGIKVVSSYFGTSRSGDPIDDNGHGTHVAGTIGAVANSGGDAVGVAWQVKIMALKFLGSDGSGALDDSIDCIDYAIANGARVINASYGGGQYSRACKAAIDRANDAGILFVAAAGNEYNNNDRYPAYPASYESENVVSVAAINRHGALADFSNYGRTQVDIGAPGVNIFSTWHNSNNSYNTISGTSMASPHVAGAAAVLFSNEPSLRPTEARSRFIETAAPLNSLSGNVVSGGMLDLNSALGTTPPDTLKIQVTPYPARPARGEELVIGVRVSALQPITGANVQVTASNQLFLTLQDDGRTPDQSANDGIYSGAMRTPDRSSLDLTVSASHSNFLPTSQTISLETIDLPDNDSFSKAFTIGQSATSTVGNNVEATLESNEPIFIENVASTVWYSWRPGAEGDATINTHGSSIDTTLAIFTGSSLASLSMVASNDDASDEQLTSEVSFYSSADQKYWIQVGGYDGESGEFIINHPAPTPPAEPPAPPQETLPPTVVTQPKDISVTEGESTTLQVVVEGTPPFEYQWILNGGVIQGAVNPTLSLQRLTISQSGEYSIMVKNTAGFEVVSIANLSVRESKEVPANDDIENAEILFEESGTEYAINRMATGQRGEPDHANVPPPRHSVWWKWRAPRDGTLQINTKGSSFDTLLAAYRSTEEISSTNRRSFRTAPIFIPPTKNTPARLNLPNHALSSGDKIELIGLLNHSSSNAVFLVEVNSPDQISLSGTSGLINLRLSPTGEARKQF